MQKRTILFISLFTIFSVSAVAEELKLESNKIEIESMSIETLIEKAKTVAEDEREKIENIIKKKIAQAHRENSHKG